MGTDAKSRRGWFCFCSFIVVMLSRCFLIYLTFLIKIRYVIDGRKQIFMSTPQPGDDKLECGEVEFEAQEAYIIGINEIVVSLSLFFFLNFYQYYRC